MRSYQDMEITGSVTVSGSITGGTIIADSVLADTSSIVSASYAATASDALNVVSSLGYTGISLQYYENTLNSDSIYYYSASAGTSFIKVEAWGGGGGGGAGRAINQSGYGSAGAGGSGGAYVRRFYKTKDIPDGLKLTVGHAGNGSSAGTGQDGSDTVIEVSGSNPQNIPTMTAGGGLGGAYTYVQIASNAAVGGALVSGLQPGGTASGGQINLDGGKGMPYAFLTPSDAVCSGGTGGTTPYVASIRGGGFAAESSGGDNWSDAGFDHTLHGTASLYANGNNLRTPGVGGGGGAQRGDTDESAYGSAGGIGVVKITEYTS